MKSDTISNSRIILVKLFVLISRVLEIVLEKCKRHKAELEGRLPRNNKIRNIVWPIHSQTRTKGISVMLSLVFKKSEMHKMLGVPSEHRLI